MNQFARTVIMLWMKGLSVARIVEECRKAGNSEVDETDIEWIVESEAFYPEPAISPVGAVE